METKEQRKERLLKLLQEIKEDTYNYVDMNDNDFIEEYNIKQIESEYDNNINELRKSDELDYFWFKQAFKKLYSIKYHWYWYDGFRKFMGIKNKEDKSWIQKIKK